MSAEVELGWNNADLLSGARQAGNIVDNEASRMRKALASIGSGVGIGAGFGIFSAATDIIRGASGALFDATLTADSLQGGMIALEGSIDSANQRLNEMRELAKDPGLGFEQVVRGDIALRSTGLSADLATRSMKEFGNALAVVGKGKADLDGVFLAITQIVSKGKVSAEEINQIAERVPQIRKVMQEAFGTADTEAIQKMGIPVERFIELVVSGFERTVPRATVRMQGKIDNFTDAFQARLADLGAGIAEGLIGPLDEVTERLESNDKNAQAFGSTIGTLTAGMLDFGKTTAGVVIGAIDGWGQLGQSAVMAGLDMLGFERVSQQTAEETVRMKDANLAAARVAADLARHQKELEAATKRVADAQAEATKRANERAMAEAKLTEKVTENTVAAKKAFEAERNRTADLYLSDEEKLEKVKARILDIDRQINATSGQAGGEEITYKLMQEREKSMQELLRLSQAISAAQEKDNSTGTKTLETTAKRVAAQEDAMRLFELELSIAEALARGQDRKAEKLTRERDIIEETAQLMSELGLSYEEAAKKAEQLVNAEARANARQNGGDGTGARSTIQGYQQSQGDANDARARAQGRVDEARNQYDAAISRYFGTFSEIDAAQSQKFNGMFGSAPAENAPTKPAGDATVGLVDRFEKWAQATSEVFEKALG